MMCCTPGTLGRESAYELPATPPASFGVALALGSGWFPPESKGLAMGIAGAGNSGTAIATFFAPMLAKTYGWQTVYGFAGLMMLLPFLVMLFLAKEPPDREGEHSFLDHIKCLFQPDGWMFNAVYIITFGGFLGLATYLPTFFHDQFGIDPAEAKWYTTFAVLMGSGTRVLGGYLADIPADRITAAPRAALPESAPSAAEGKRLLRLHYYRERKSSLVKAKRREILAQTGRLACAACDGDYEQTYDSAAVRVFEVHHLSPLGDLEDIEATTTLDQLALVCANCHRVLHRTRPPLLIGALRTLLVR